MLSLLNSALLATGALAIALPCGTILAVLLTRFSIHGRRFAVACLGVLLFLPLYVQLSAWDAAFGKLGWFTVSHGSLAQPFLSGLRGAICIHGLAAIPWVTLIVALGMMQLDRTQEEAALLVVPSRSVLWRITLPQSVPFLIAAAIWTVIGTISEMTVTNIYLINPDQWTFTERFYMSWSLQHEPISKIDYLIGIGFLAFVMVLTLRIVDQYARFAHSPSVAAIHPFITNCTFPATLILWGIVILLVGVPLASLCSKAGFVVLHANSERIPSWSLFKCLTEVAQAPLRFSAELRGTLLTAGLAATAALAIALPLAWLARRRRWSSIPATLVAAVAIAVPGPLVGVGLIALLNHDLPPHLPFTDGTIKSWLLLLYDNTPLAPVVAQSIRALPPTILLLWYSFATLNPDVLAAATLAGLSQSRVLWKIAIPQRWRTVTAAWIVAFAVAAGDLAWCHLVTPPGLDLLQRRIFGLVHSGVEEQVAAISLLVITLYAVLATAILWLMDFKHQPLTRSIGASAVRVS